MQPQPPCSFPYRGLTGRLAEELRDRGMENAYTKTPAEVLKHFQTKEARGLSAQQVNDSRKKHGRNALPEDPPTPIWELILEQFKDQLVIILLGSAAVSFVLALFDQDEGWTAFVDPAVVSINISPGHTIHSFALTNHNTRSLPSSSSTLS